VLLLYR